MPATSLNDLQEQIAQRERELQTLRQELEARQSHLSELAQRKQEFLDQLHQVEQEIAALGETYKEQAKPSQPAPTSTPKAAPKPGKATPDAKKSKGTAPSWPESASTTKPGHREQPPVREVLICLIENSRKPLFASQLAAQALAEGYHSNSKSFTNTVSALLTNMDDVRHIKGQGYLLRRKAGVERSFLLNARYQLGFTDVAVPHREKQICLL